MILPGVSPQAHAAAINGKYGYFDDRPAETSGASILRGFIERIERLESEKAKIANDIREVYAEAKGTGFDTRAIRAVIKLRSLDPASRQEFESIVDLYKDALGLA